MLDASYIGDELTGTGFALVGIRARPAPDTAEGVWRLLLRERERRALVMLSAECARGIGQRLAELLECRPLPPVVVLPDPEAGGGPDDVIRNALAALGVEGMSR